MFRWDTELYREHRIHFKSTRIGIHFQRINIELSTSKCSGGTLNYTGSTEFHFKSTRIGTHFQSGRASSGFLWFPVAAEFLWEAEPGSALSDQNLNGCAGSSSQDTESLTKTSRIILADAIRIKKTKEAAERFLFRRHLDPRRFPECKSFSAFNIFSRGRETLWKSKFV